MSLDLNLKDPQQAAAILAALEIKDGSLCRYPTCEELRQASTGTGRNSVYCENPEHNAVNSHRIRQQLRTAATLGKAPEAISKRETSTAPIMVPVESLRSSVLSRITLLQGDLERYVTVLAQMSDPDVSAAQIKAALDQATMHVAEAQQKLSAEQALRLKAEAALQTAQDETRSEREAAEQAIQLMEEAEINAQHRIEQAEISTQQQIEQAELRIQTIETERDTSVNQMRIETQQLRERIGQEAREAIALAQKATSVALEEARAATVTTLEARAQATTAERLVNEAHIALDRERTEIDRLREELANTKTEMQRRAEADRVESQTALQRERSEIDRLREELIATRKQVEQVTLRADKMATTNDELRAQLIQNQMRQSTQPQPQ